MSGVITSIAERRAHGLGDGGVQTLQYRRLAIHVINLALRDLTSAGGSDADRESARTFFAGSRMMRHWCAVAELDAIRLVRHVAALREAHLLEASAVDAAAVRTR